MKFNRILIAFFAGAAVLAGCQPIEKVTLNLADSTAPAMTSFDIDSDVITASYSPAVIYAGSEQVKPELVYHNLAIVKVKDGAEQHEVSAKVESEENKDERVIITKLSAVTNALLGLGYSYGDQVDIELVVRAQLSSAATNGFLDSQASAAIDGFVLEKPVPGGKPKIPDIDLSQYEDIDVMKGADTWGIIGPAVLDWNEDYDLQKISDDPEVWYASNVPFVSDSFKFRGNDTWGDYDLGGGEFAIDAPIVMSKGGSDMAATAGSYDVFLFPVKGVAYLTASSGEQLPDIDLSQYEFMDIMAGADTWGIIGPAVSDWSTDVDLEKISDDPEIWVGKNIPFQEDEFKFRGNDTWGDYDLGGAPEFVLDTPLQLSKGGANLRSVAGVYNVYLYPTYMLVYITNGSGDTPPPPAKPKAWSVIGTLEDSGWEKDYDLQNVSGDVWTIKNLFVREQDEFKIRADHDWAKSYGGPEENAESTYEAGNVYGVYQPVLGQAFAAGGKNIRIGVEGNYNITLTYGDEPTILIEEYREFPEHLYMTRTDFGDWSWGEGTVELWPVINKPDWDEGKAADGQFYTIRYFTTNGFKFNGAKAWDGGQFGTLETNKGFTNDGDGNVIVPEEGFYLVHIDLKNSILDVEPARVYGIGDAFGSWDSAVADNRFTADGRVMKVTAPKGGKLRMYVESDIATTSWWTREFNLIDGQIVPRVLDELAAPDILAGQVVTLNFNEGTGTITGEGEAPAYKTEISVPGAYSGSEWDLDTAPKLLGKGDGEFKGALVMYKQGDAAVEFKFGHDGSWIGGTADGLNYTLGANDNMAIDEGTYFWTVNLESKTATALKVEKVGLIGSFNEWSDDVVLTFNAEDHTYNGTVTLGENAELKVRFNGNWDYSLGGDLNRLQAVNDNCKVAEAGTYTAKLDLNKGTLTLTK